MCNLEKYNATELVIRNIKDDFEKRSMYHNEKITINCVDDYEYKSGSRPKSKVFTCDDGKIDIGECRRKLFDNINRITQILVFNILSSMLYF